MYRSFAIILLFCFITGNSIFICFAQPEPAAESSEKYWIFFCDKKEVHFNPLTYFDPKTIARRMKYGIPLADSLDFPVNETYLQRVCEITGSVKITSRWLNAAVVIATKEQINQIIAFPFVARVEKIVSECRLAGNRSSPDTIKIKLSDSDSILLEKQIKRMQGEKFIQKGIDGNGVRVAVFDAGFPWVNTHPAFEHIRKENRILKTYDFVKSDEFVYDYSSHGTGVLSNIAGLMEGRHIGLATGAEFLLARTEQAAGEPFSEEENWVAAIEWADKNGADMVSSSLGYTYHRYFPEQMDGKTTYISRAANIAARKGLLVINAAGNDGSGRWKKLGAPADADSIVTVGGFNPGSDYHINFSSYGPTADMRRKPNVAAYGSAIIAGKNGLEHAFGTSFATPLVTGFTACAWQTKRDLNNMEMFRELEKSGHLYPYFDYAHGYGIPQASYFTDSVFSPPDTTFTMSINTPFVTILVKKMASDTVTDTVQIVAGLIESLLTKSFRKNLLFYHIENDKGYLDKYFVVDITGRDEYVIDVGDVKPGYILRVHNKGYTEVYKF
ncbi:MAG: S8 family serine peptidase [Bacteroidetes bacterium]|nr:S8 family serine peptidase [Bacteroidota bacterium]